MRSEVFDLGSNGDVVLTDLEGAFVVERVLEVLAPLGTILGRSEEDQLRVCDAVLTLDDEVVRIVAAPRVEARGMARSVRTAFGGAG